LVLTGFESQLAKSIFTTAAVPEPTESHCQPSSPKPLVNLNRFKKSLMPESRNEWRCRPFPVSESNGGGQAGTLSQQSFTTDWNWSVPAPRLDSWYNWLSEPVRTKIFATSAQQAFATE
jgi:hypothetical protein